MEETLPMSAGDSIDDYFQDAAEAHLVWKLQEVTLERGLYSSSRRSSGSEG